MASKNWVNDFKQGAMSRDPQARQPIRPMPNQHSVMNQAAAAASHPMQGRPQMPMPIPNPNPAGMQQSQMASGGVPQGGMSQPIGGQMAPPWANQSSMGNQAMGNGAMGRAYQNLNPDSAFGFGNALGGMGQGQPGFNGGTQGMQQPMMPQTGGPLQGQPGGIDPGFNAPGGMQFQGQGGRPPLDPRFNVGQGGPMSNQVMNNAAGAVPHGMPQPMQGGMQRVSPGIYRGPNGQLVRR